MDKIKEVVKERVRGYFKENTEFVSSHSMLLNDVLTIVHTNGLYTIRVHANKIKRGYTYVVDYKCRDTRDYVVFMNDIETLDDVEDALVELQMKLDIEGV